MEATPINLAHFPSHVHNWPGIIIEIVNVTCTAGLSAVAVQMQLRKASVGYVLSRALVFVSEILAVTNTI